MRRRPALIPLLTLAFSLLVLAGSARRARAEAGSPPEIGRGQSVERSGAKLLAAPRSRLLRDLAREHAAELDSLAARAAAEPARANALHREIEAAKRRHVREEIELQRAVALRDGRVALARRLELRLSRLDAATAGAR